MAYVSTSELNSFVDRNLRASIVDQRYDSHPLTGILRDKGHIILEDGGGIIAQPILSQENDTAITYAGADILPTDIQEEVTNYEVTWKQAQASVTLTGLQISQVSGKHAYMNLVANKTELAYMALFNKIGSQAFANGTGNFGRDWDGIGAAINDASGFQVYLNIDRAANPWWQAQVLDPGAPTALAAANMMTLWMNCTIDEQRISLIISTRAGYASFWGLLTPQEQFIDSRVASLGFDNIAFQGAPLVFDSSCPASTMYFINLEHLRLFADKKNNFKFTGMQTPINQDVEAGHVKVYGNWELRSPRSCGVYRNISNG